MKSKNWVNRQKNDQFVKKAKQLGYINRAAFKLEEIEQKYKIIEHSREILELGSSPGGWTQVILNYNSKTNITCFDLLDMKMNNQRIAFYREDFLKFNFTNLKNKFDLVLSDVAPNTTGHQSTDHLRISQLIYEVIDRLEIILKKQGSFIFKIWKGEEEKEIIKMLKKIFDKVEYFKPKSSRQESSEIFIISRGFRLHEE
jgi:23S rRNA (uridine2552-2'-O)-methyltransferase|tara:strand:- start:70 stop:669 length:600 start_codon:yes stop_codon:yes gene_type:complete